MLRVSASLRTAGAFGLLFLAMVLATTSSEMGYALWLDPGSSAALWRGWSHVFVHADIGHLAVNTIGTVALCFLWPQLSQSLRSWALIWLLYGAAAPLAVDGPAYGLSGLLHGVFAYAALRWPFDARTPVLRSVVRGLLLTGIGLKLAAESQGWVDTQGVAWHLHILGALSGAVAWAIEKSLQKYKTAALDLVRSLR